MQNLFVISGAFYFFNIINLLLAKLPSTIHGIGYSIPLPVFMFFLKSIAFRYPSNVVAILNTVE